MRLLCIVSAMPDPPDAPMTRIVSLVLRGTDPRGCVYEIYEDCKGAGC